jgi:quinol monooxygenase YgiN
MTVISQVKPQKELEFRQTLESLLGNGKEGKEEGLKKTTLYQEVNEPTGFRLILEWETQKYLENYLRTGKFRLLLGALKVLCNESEIRYSSPPEKGAGIKDGNLAI